MEIITVRALGREAKIGDFYDVRRDQFLGERISLDDFPKTSVTMLDVNEQRMKLHPSQGFSSRLEALSLTGTTALNLMLGLIPPKGSNRFVVNRNFSSNMANCAFLQQITTKIELINLEDVKKYIKQEELKETSATHIVAGVTWGSVTVIDVWKKLDAEDEETKGNSEEKFNAEIDAFLKSMDSDNQVVDKDARIELQFKMYGDLLDDDQPETIEEAVNYLKNLDRALVTENLNLGCPLQYLLLPITAISDSHIGIEEDQGSAILSFDEEKFNQFLQIMDEFILTKQAVKNLQEFVNINRDCIPDKKLDEIIHHFDILEDTEDKFRNEIESRRFFLLSTTAKMCELKTLMEIIRKCNEEVRNFIESFHQVKTKIQFLEECIKWKNVFYVGNEDTFCPKNLKNIQECYVFFYSGDPEMEYPNLEDNICYFKEIIEKLNSNLSKCIIVDIDLQPEWKKKGVCIQLYKSGNLICKNLLISSAYVEIYNLRECPKPPQRNVLKISCPGSFMGYCSDKEHVWNCTKCDEPLEYGFDDFLYCKCGAAPILSYHFKCNDFNHGSKFSKIPQMHLNSMLKKLKPVEEINILLLGETGVGKSTFLNAFINYMTYESLEEAKVNEVLHLIASKFTSSVLNDKREYVEKIIEFGKDENENHGTGESTTQNPQTYTYQLKDETGEEKRIRFIDTPGIGDTRGTKFDDINFSNILACLNSYDELHGILILLKPNESKLTVTFRYCVKELLTHLHRSACRNISFVFTNSRSTDYHPGDTLPILRKLLSEIEDVKIPLTEENMYFMDNESFRFLVLQKNDVEFNEEHHRNYSGSWDISVRETKRLLKHVFQLPPHVLNDTQSLNKVRQMIVSLTKPLADISQKIQGNISLMKEKENEIKNLDLKKEDLKKELTIVYEVLKPKPLPYPRTVCVDGKCVKVEKVNGVQQTYFVQVCHERCYLQGVQAESYPNPDLKGCWCMNGRLTCQHDECGCSWEKHMHIYYEYESVPILIEDEFVRGQLDEKITTKAQVESALDKIQELKAMMENEKEVITEVSAKFATFLKVNAIAPYNDAMADYLTHLIELEKVKINAGGNDETMEGMKKMLNSYREQISILEDAIKDRSEERIEINDISSMVTKLYGLCLFGESLKEIVEVADRAKAQERRFMEKSIPPTYCKHMSKKKRGFISNIKHKVSDLFNKPFNYRSQINMKKWNYDHNFGIVF